jgi:glycoside/pentoside/hexuronide:cation symporter, GPH family
MVLDKLTWHRKIGFAVGDFGLNLYWQSVSFFLIYFYTDTVGIPAATAGLIFMGATIFEACIDPLAGAFMDRFQTAWGRYRPWVLVGSVPLGAAFALLYWQPSVGGTVLIGFLVGVQLFFRLSYTAVAVPFSALTARMTDSSVERTTLAGLRMLFAMAAGAIVAYCTQPLEAILGSGDARRGAFGAALAISAVATAIFGVVFGAAREEIQREALPPARLVDYFNGVRHNRAFITLVVGLIFASASATTISRVAIYYFKYVVGQESATRYALAISSVTAFFAVPVWMAVGRQMGKRDMWLVALGIGLCVLITFAALRPTTQLGATAFFASMQVSNIGVSVAYWSMLPDTVEYGVWRTGVRQESFLFGLFSFFQKMGLGISAGIFGWAFDMIGYLPGDHQAPRTVAGIGCVITTLCLIGLVGSAVATYLSPLKRGVHESLVERLSSSGLVSGGDGRSKS